MGSHRLSVFLCLLALTACAGPVETRITSSGQGAAASSILNEPPHSGGEQLQARQLVIARLQAKGFQLSDAGMLQLHVAFAERDASISVKTGDAAAVRDIAAAKTKKPLQSCADREMRITVILTRIGDGAELYRGNAAEYHCKALATEVLPQLVEAALRDYSNPKGSYRITRSGRD